jgi:hypothetical protein
VIDEHTLVDGGQTAEAIAERLIAWLRYPAVAVAGCAAS